MNLRNSKVLNDPYTSTLQQRIPSTEENTSLKSARMANRQTSDNVDNEYVSHQGVDQENLESERATTPPCEETEEDKLTKLMTILQTLAINDATFTPAQFTGNEKDTEKTERWIEYFNNYTSFRGIDEPAKLKLFKLLLTGPAAEWIRSLPTNITDNFPLLTIEFRQRFSMTDITRWQKATSMWTREQAANESVDAYITDIINMARIVPITDKELIRFAIIKGLKTNIKIHVLQSEPKSIDDVTRTARVAEAAQAATNKSDTDVSALSTQMAEMIKMMKSNATATILNVNAPTPQQHRSPSPANRRVQFEERRPQRREQPQQSNWSRNTTRSPSWERQPQYANSIPTQDFRTSPRHQQPTRWNRTLNDQPAQHLQQGQYTNASVLRDNICTRCGLTHNPNNCNAINSCCFKCGQPGHYSRMCLSNFEQQYRPPYTGNRQH
jgi:hypothetical protein